MPPRAVQPNVRIATSTRGGRFLEIFRRGDLKVLVSRCLAFNPPRDRSDLRIQHYLPVQPSTALSDIFHRTDVAEAAAAGPAETSKTLAPHRIMQVVNTRLVTSRLHQG